MCRCIKAVQQTAFVIPSFGDLVKLTLVDLVRPFWELRVVCGELWAGLGRRALRRACEGLPDVPNVLDVPDVLPALLIQEMHGQTYRQRRRDDRPTERVVAEASTTYG